MINVKQKNFTKETVIFLLTLCFAVVLSVRGDTSNVVLEGINLFVFTLLPSLFPYFFITAVLNSLNCTAKFSKALSPITKKIFRVNGLCGYAFIMSIISGYPIGANIISNLYEKNLISKTEAERGVAFCSTSSPMFLVGCVGLIMFNDKKFGAVLLATHFVSIIITGVIFSFYKRKEGATEFKTYVSTQKTEDFFGNACFEAVLSVLKVGSLITVFYVIIQTLLSLKVLNAPISLFGIIFGDKLLGKAFTLGLLEVTSGLKVLSTTARSIFTLPVTAMLCGFGGISVIMQSLAFIKKAKIKTAPFIVAKLLTAVLNFGLGFIFNFLL